MYKVDDSEARQYFEIARDDKKVLGGQRQQVRDQLKKVKDLFDDAQYCPASAMAHVLARKLEILEVMAEEVYPRYPEVHEDE